MKGNRRSYALLVELMMVIVFFMLSSTVLVRVFWTAARESRRAENLTMAVQEAQNVAERLYGAPSAESELEQMGFVRENGGWSRDAGSWVLRVTAADEETARGVLHRRTVTAWIDGELCLTLPCSAYEEGAY